MKSAAAIEQPEKSKKNYDRRMFAGPFQILRWSTHASVHHTSTRVTRGQASLSCHLASLVELPQNAFFFADYIKDVYAHIRECVSFPVVWLPTPRSEPDHARARFYLGPGSRETQEVSFVREPVLWDASCSRTPRGTEAKKLIGTGGEKPRLPPLVERKRY